MGGKLAQEVDDSEQQNNVHILVTDHIKYCKMAFNILTLLTTKDEIYIQTMNGVK